MFRDRLDFLLAKLSAILSRQRFPPTEPLKQLFDAAWYAEKYKDAVGTDADQFEHYMRRGWTEGRDPHPLFSTLWYLEVNPDVKASGLNPLLHFMSDGHREGRSPHPLFDTAYYLRENPDVAATGVNPVIHYLKHGASEGRKPSQLFDVDAYVRKYPDVARAGINPLLHFVTSGSSEGRNPNRLFQTGWYNKNNPDVVAQGLISIVHYMLVGAREGRDPHPRFSTTGYLAANPDVAAAGLNPLAHYLAKGQKEDRRIFNSKNHVTMSEIYGENDEVMASSLAKLDEEGLNWITAYFHFRPMNVSIDPRRSARPSLWVLLPGIHSRYATGGPNTAYILGCLLAKAGIPVNFVSLDAPPDQDLGPIKQHLSKLMGLDVTRLSIDYHDAHDRDVPLQVGYDDIFLATAWWTAQPAKAAASLLRNKRFYYLIQDYECLFYGASVQFAVSQQTYNFDHLPIINTKLLRDHLIHEKVGRYADEGFCRQAIAFDPAVDRDHFYPEERAPNAKKRLLFYTRPTMAERNLFGLGIVALRAAVEAGLFAPNEWEFIGMGEPLDPIPLGRGYDLVTAPWFDFESYAALMRSGEILLSLMQSPHPSYPPLEMAACGGYVVTTIFGSKTADRLRELSPKIIGVTPTVENILLALTKAVGLSFSRRTAPHFISPLPQSWIESLSEVLPSVLAAIDNDSPRMRGSAAPSFAKPESVVVSNHAPSLVASYAAEQQRRLHQFRPASSSDLITLVTRVDHASPQLLLDLGESVVGQDTENDFQWLILADRTKSPDLEAVLRRLLMDSRVSVLDQSDSMPESDSLHQSLMQANGRHIIAVGIGNVLLPDAIRTAESFLEQAGFPPIVYTDDSIGPGAVYLEAGGKPEWDPVLFAHSGHVNQVWIFERIIGLELGCWTDAAVDGRQDWDLAMRFLIGGHQPVHLAEVLCRSAFEPERPTHQAKTPSALMAADAAVLERFFLARAYEYAFELSFSRFRPPSSSSMISAVGPLEQVGAVLLAEIVDRDALLEQLMAEATPDMIHLTGHTSSQIGALSVTQGLTLLTLFPDSVIVGGSIHDGVTVKEAGYVFGYGGFIGCPDVGRGLGDPGYLEFLATPRSVAAVSARNCLVRREFLKTAMLDLPQQLSLAALGIWLGAVAASQGKRVIYAPGCECVVPADVTFSPSAAEAVCLFARFGDLSHHSVGYVEGFDLSGEHPYAPGPNPGLPWNPALDYVDFARAKEAALPVPFPVAGRPRSRRLCIITTVYVGTDAGLFDQTAASIDAQVVPPSEWIILAHGPISAALDDKLRQLERERRITLLRRDSNLGIQGGLRVCLEQATSDLVLPLDADDLLTKNAVAYFEHASDQHPDAKVFYSDESLIINGRPAHAFYRPDYDPVHMRSHSFIWHAIAFDRKMALLVGVYSARSTEFAQDWDTLLRFDNAGHRPVHIPEVLYRWRQHDASLSNSGVVNEGSLRSVQGVLQQVCESASKPKLYRVAPYPADSGMPDFYVERVRDDAPPVLLARLGDPAACERDEAAFPFDEVRCGSSKRGIDGLAALDSILDDAKQDFVLLLGPGVALHDSEGVWQALKHLELVDRVMAVGGALLRITGEILGATPIKTSGRTLVDPLVGRSMLDRGGYMFSLIKPCCVSGLYTDLMLCRTGMLRDAISARPASLALRSLGAYLGSYADRTDKLLAYEPLLRGIVEQKRRLISDNVYGLQTSMRTYPPSGGAVTFAQRTISGFLSHERIHSK